MTSKNDTDSLSRVYKVFGMTRIIQPSLKSEVPSNEVLKFYEKGEGRNNTLCFLQGQNFRITITIKD